MAKKTVITIGRHYGSGGKEIGKKLADKLGVTFYDEELVTMAAEKSNIDKGVLSNVDEKATGSLLYSLVMSGGLRGLTTPMYYEMPLNDKLFIAQSDVIKKIAKDGSCVIVGRCADYVLEGEDCDTFNVFLYADTEFKVERIQRLYNLDRKSALDRINKTEKQRRAYYNYYSHKEWGNMNGYDLCLNTATIGIDHAVEIIKSCIEELER
ncbi:MAG: cytidylate kinase-like family protein [Clostridia bacterium]|nr:cytidylate kinase-like family protein [Clostridia bacterium]